MPEGDTIFKLARALAPMLEGRILRRAVVRSVEASALAGRRVAAVEAAGKHLLVSLADPEAAAADLLLRTHLGLHGSWHQYPRGAPWKRPVRQASLVLETVDRTFVCFNAKDVACLRASRRKLDRALSRLGPDLLGETVDFAAILYRLSRRHASEPVANLLLDQSIACGIGNVFKSEVLFVTGHLPEKPLHRLDEAERLSVYRLARELLSANTERGFRTTTGARPGDLHAPRLWVYGRAGLACLRCAASIRFARMGRHRSTYWCPRCQS